VKKHLCASAIALVSAPGVQADTLADAFRNGTVSGDINLFYKNMDNNSGTDQAYGTGFLGFKYETAPFHNLQLGLALRHGSEVHEQNSGDSDEGVGTLLTEAYISYQGDGLGLVAGRQAIDLEWVGDYHEAVTLSSSALANTELTAGYSRSLAVADEDDLQHSFSDIGEDGAWFLDGKITPLEGLSLNPYYLHANDIFSGIGLKADLEHESGLGLTAHYAASDVDVAGEQDGDILHLEIRGSLGELALAAGYIATDEQGGIGHLDQMGENINPLEEGNQVYVADAKTWYLGAGYTLGKASFGLLYGDSDYAASAREQELDLTFSYDLGAVAENLSIDLVYAMIDADSSANDYDKATLMLSYGF